MGACLLFSSPKSIAQQRSEKAFLSAFTQYDIIDSSPAIGIGASCNFNKKLSYINSNSLEMGIFVLAGKKVVLDEVYLKYFWEDNWTKTTLAFVKNASQKIGWGMESGYFFGKSIKIGASATVLNVPAEYSRMQFYIKPQIEYDYKFLQAKFSYLLNWIPGKAPFAYANGAEVNICASHNSWSIFGEYAQLATDSKSIFHYWRTGIKYQF